MSLPDFGLHGKVSTVTGGKRGMGKAIDWLLWRQSSCSICSRTRFIIKLATIFDGYPMSVKGQAGRDLGMSAVSSLIGGVAGLILFLLMLLFLRRVIWAFSSPEIFLLTMFGLSSLAVITRGKTTKGLATTAFRLLVGLVGFHQQTRAIRFTFGIGDPWDGSKLLPVFFGVFAIAEILTLAA